MFSRKSDAGSAAGRFAEGLWYPNKWSADGISGRIVSGGAAINMEAALTNTNATSANITPAFEHD